MFPGPAARPPPTRSTFLLPLENKYPSLSAPRSDAGASPGPASELRPGGRGIGPGDSSWTGVWGLGGTDRPTCLVPVYLPSYLTHRSYVGWTSSRVSQGPSDGRRYGVRDTTPVGPSMVRLSVDPDVTPLHRVSSDVSTLSPPRRRYPRLLSRPLALPSGHGSGTPFGLDPRRLLPVIAPRGPISAR